MVALVRCEQCNTYHLASCANAEIPYFPDVLEVQQDARCTRSSNLVAVQGQLLRVVDSQFISQWQRFIYLYA